MAVPLLPETPDAELIHATLHDHPEKFNELIQKHQASIFRLVFRQVRQREEAEDVVQGVFFQAFQHLKSFRGESRFLTWLYSIALNMIRNHIRQRKRRQTESMDAPQNGDDDRPRQWPDKTPPTDDIVHHRIELLRVQQAARTLAEPYRAIFALHYFGHRSLHEVAARIHRPQGTVKVYLHRARAMVLAELERSANVTTPPIPESHTA